jgi:hypothetical protein
MSRTTLIRNTDLIIARLRLLLDHLSRHAFLAGDGGSAFLLDGSGGSLDSLRGSLRGRLRGRLRSRLPLRSSPGLLARRRGRSVLLGDSSLDGGDGRRNRGSGSLGLGRVSGSLLGSGGLGLELRLRSRRVYGFEAWRKRCSGGTYHGSCRGEACHGYV